MAMAEGACVRSKGTASVKLLPERLVTKRGHCVYHDWDVIREISLDQFLHDLRNSHALKLPESYVWVLGSGAATMSQIPTGSVLAKRWLGELFGIKDPKATPGDIASWDAARELGLPGLDALEPAPFYGRLFNLRFGHRPKLGQEFLRSQILGRTPATRPRGARWRKGGWRVPRRPTVTGPPPAGAGGAPNQEFKAGSFYFASKSTVFTGRSQWGSSSTA